MGFGDNCPPAATKPRDLQGHRHSARPSPWVEGGLGWGVCAVGHWPPALLSMGSAFWAAVLLAELGILCSGRCGLAVPALLGSVGELRALKQQERPANETNEQGQNPRARSLRHLTEPRRATVVQTVRNYRDRVGSDVEAWGWEKAESSGNDRAAPTVQGTEQAGRCRGSLGPGECRPPPGSRLCHRGLCLCSYQDLGLNPTSDTAHL